MKKIKTKYISVEEMRDRLSISKTMAYQLATSGCVEAVKIGRCVRVSEDSLARFLETVRYSKDQGR